MRNRERSSPLDLANWVS